MALTLSRLVRAAARRSVEFAADQFADCPALAACEGTTLLQRIFPLGVKSAPASLVPPKSSPMTAMLVMIESRLLLEQRVREASRL